MQFFSVRRRTTTFQNVHFRYLLTTSGIRRAPEIVNKTLDRALELWEARVTAVLIACVQAGFATGWRITEGTACAA